MPQQIHKNEVTLCGTAAASPEYSHLNHQERFYKFPLEICRLSGKADELIIVAGERLLERCGVCEGMRLGIAGQLRSYNNKTGRGSRLMLTVFARSMEYGVEEDHNEIFLSGVLCKPPLRRSTPLGREICDMMVAVNRLYGRSDYIPCIAWGALADEMDRRGVGDPVSFQGRIQSRIYHKTTDAGVEERTAYEVSVMNLTEEEV